MKLFLFTVVKNLALYWAAKLLKPESITELIISLGKVHAERTDTKTDDRLVEWLEKNIK
ncbi:hypothetical protein K6U20_11815 [Vibrio fluvialis]|uniref:hypothetical protein n=1 Tax=Vibrio fluvialis TaxID=676 RepID=UPI001F2A27B9|nr:hypothetical protein [Vibrio fluvialis]MCE7580943.1 hypothetical protein [Vibrio fluvialis]MCG6405309.1 hypothetical protein [Vibrio fluvialis]WDY54289.1 hypothetical protein PUN47_20790 [Vibrio fluvialis]